MVREMGGAVRRRTVLQGVGASLAATLLPGTAAFAQDAPRFTRATVIDLARGLASADFVPPEPAVPGELLSLTSSAYRQIRALPESWPFANASSGFAIEPLHSGFIYREPVQLFVVRDETAYKMAFSSESFTYPDLEGIPPDAPLEFAGFRGYTTFGHEQAPEPFVVFAGASYFQALSRGQVFGLQARGLAIRTGDPAGEEFPSFRAFWIEEPADGRMVVHALLDSASVTGAYRFTIRPGEETVIDVEATLFARADVDQLGLAPLTSMYLFGAVGDGPSDELRRAAHNSDGLAIWNGKDERLWRPLQNPRLLQVSSFADTGPRGFGLIQREKRFSEYEDLDARFERRPSLWVEPIGDWGAGNVVLVEIPSDREINDNVVAFWRPEEALTAGGEMTLTYRLTWSWDAPIPSDLLRVTRTLTGDGPGSGQRSFVIDYSDTGRPEPVSLEGMTAQVRTSSGAVSHSEVKAHPVIGGLRVSFVLEPAAEEADLRVDLLRDGAPAAEVWLYRWTS